MNFEKLILSPINKLKDLFLLLGTTSTALAISGLVAILLAIIFLLVIPGLRDIGTIIGIIGIVSILTAMTLSYRKIRSSILSKQGKYGTLTVIMVFSVITILIIINVIIQQYTVRFDLTQTNQFTLAPRTLDILKNLPNDIEAIAFYAPTDATQASLKPQLDSLFNEFEIRSKGKFSYKFVNPVEEVELAKSLGAAKYMDVVLSKIIVEEKTEVVSKEHYIVNSPTAREQDFVEGLLILTGEERKTIYLLSGHGENTFLPQPGAQEIEHIVLQSLKSDLYELGLLNLQATKNIPDNAAALIIISPDQPLLPGEDEMIANYLNKGGRLLAMIDPTSPNSWRDLLKDWGIDIQPGYVYDSVNYNNKPLTPFPQLGILPFVNGNPVQTSEELTEEQTLFAQSLGPTIYALPDNVNSTIYFPGTSPILPISDGSFNGTFVALSLSSQYSGKVTDASEETLPDPDEIRPFVLAAAVKSQQKNNPTAKEALIVVFGDADFITNEHFEKGSNGEFFLNTVNWLTESYNLISIRPKQETIRYLHLTNNEFIFVRFTSWFLMPIIMALIAFIVYWKRR